MKTNRKTAQKGQSLAEYGLILALIAVVCIAGLTTMGTSLNTQLSAVGGRITTAIR